MDRSDPAILRAGVGRADITPPEDCFLEGFAARDHTAEGIHDPLKVTALALSRYNRRVVLVTLDILDLPDTIVDTIWEKAGHHYHLEPRDLLLNSSHTHAGPMTWPRVPNRFCSDRRQCIPDERYLHRLVENIVTAIGMALGALEPANAYFGCGETRIGICRRAKDASVYRGDPSGYLGIYANYPNPDREIDHACPVLFLTNGEENPLALVYGAPCHPTTMSHDNYLVSAEYPGVTRRILEERFGAPALFLQGIGGDVKPARVAEHDRFRSGNYHDVDRVGAELAADVLRVMDRGLRPLDIRIRRAVNRFPVPLAPGWGETEFRRYAAENQPLHRRIWGEWWLDRIRAGEPLPRSMNMTLSILELAEDLRFTGIAGELLTGMGIKIRRSFPSGTTLPLGYSNGRTTYIPDSDVLREGGYEAIETIFFTPGMPAPWREDIDDTVLGAYRTLAQTLD